MSVCAQIDFPVPALRFFDAKPSGDHFIFTKSVNEQENNQERDVFNKIPVLGSLPIFGSLFKSKDEQKNRTDLVVLVTPEVTMPINSTDAVPNLYMPP